MVTSNVQQRLWIYQEHKNHERNTLQTNACSKSTIETLEKGEKYVQG